MRFWVRRIVAVLALAAVAVAVGLVVRQIGPSDPVVNGSPAAHGTSISRYTITSRYAHLTLRQVAVKPAGAGAGRPLLVFLHGKGASPEENVNADFFAALNRLGERAPDVVFPDGGDDSYWHARSSGDWGRYMLDEVIPQAARRLHADPRRIAIGGISMGGFGAYDVARIAPQRFCAVGGHSAAMWLQAGLTAPGAFDDAADFARNDVVGMARARGRSPWGSARLWLDGGTDDPFRTADEALAGALGITMHHWPGGHTGSYWHAHYASYLRFYADALANCSRR